MTTTVEPVTEVDPRYGETGAGPRPWAEAEALLAAAPLSWVSTVRPDGRPHVTPLLTVWRDGALHFCTGAAERKARNLETNAEVVLTTGGNRWDEGLDVVVEGTAERVRDRAELVALAGAWEKKYGPVWRFEPTEEGFADPHGSALVFRVRPRTVFGFAKSPSSQTRWRFPQA
ncbi:pyridoxamine 5'-phosphate oxidase family protein [Trujillonella endophytica]|uniref:Nitroimidazol reductase NimA, pyridoxamine 5'-phosphate oxidase superfamily n=1 Tax=Trujillonella endophytica TaxID=673521 RepID=A0A1H8URU5_9ACTN|nr:pyridoxamine 5'-phosphate oxidase family protein [Trujillella endophytica]SEP05912.1 Nitroimidazol reductase NimA, pyridoxamine 5'-phosphate oxidase superfamily [Trujillella endophytica]